MAESVSNPVLRHLQNQVGKSVAASLTDRELVARFVERGDGAAFEALQRRHGPPILRLVQRLLHHEQDAEDVYQATFLILAENAASIRNPDVLGSWLYGTASRLARKCRKKARRRRIPEATSDESSGANPIAELTLREAETVLHEELARLPERYRAPLILCYFEGKTRDEAASALGYRLGTFKDRLERGKQLLHARLTRRGVAFPAVLFTGLLHANRGGTACGELIRQTCRMAAAKGEVPTRVAALVRGGMHGAIATHLKLVAISVMATLVLGTATAVTLTADTPTPAAKAGDGNARPDDPKPKAGMETKAGVDRLGDPLPPGAVMRLGTRRHRVPAYPDNWYGVPDGKSYLVVHGDWTDREIRRLDATNGTVIERWSVPGHRNVVGISPDRTKVLLVNDFIHFSGWRMQGQEEPKQDWTLTLFDLTSRSEVWKRSENLSDSQWKRLDRTLFSADGTMFVSKSRYTDNGSVVLWDAATGREIRTHRVDGKTLEALGFADGGKTLVLRDETAHEILVVDSARGTRIRTFQILARKEWENYFLSPDGTCVLAGTSSTAVRVWEIATGKERAALGEYPNWGATTMAFSRDGTTLVTGGKRLAHVRDWPSGKAVREIDLGRDGTVSDLAISGDGKRLEVLFAGEEALHFYDLATGRQQPVPVVAHNGAIYGLDTTPDGKLISFGKDASVRTWDLNAGLASDHFPVQLELNASGFAVTRDGSRFAVPGGDLESIHVCNARRGSRVLRMTEKRIAMSNLEFSPDGAWLAAWDGREKFVRVWDIKTQQTVLHLTVNLAYGVACAFSPDGTTFAVSDEGQVRFWDLPNWKESSPLPGKVHAPLGIAFSPDGRTLATAGIDGVRVFELATRKERVHLQLKEPPGGGLRFSPDGRFLAWIGGRKTVQVWDAHRDQYLKPFEGHDDDVTGLSFTRDGRSLASCSRDSTILVWDHAGRVEGRARGAAPDWKRAWDDLGSADAKVAHAAMLALAGAPDEAVAGLDQRLVATSGIDAKKLEELLKDIDHPSFQVRQKAKADIEAFGSDARSVLERFAKETPSVEARESVETILKKIRGAERSPDRLRQLRALEILERIGNDGANRLIERLAKGPADAGLTLDAKAVQLRRRN